MKFKVKAKYTLYDRITQQGTLSEPTGVPDPTYSLPSTVNWMRGLAMRIVEENIDVNYCNNFYNGVQRNNSFSDHEINSILEQLLFSLHQCSALRSLNLSPNKSDVSRIGIITWYYGIYAAASAMLFAKMGSCPDNHTSTANSWDNAIAKHGLISHPFDFRVTTLVEKDSSAELKALLEFPKINIGTTTPKNPEEAHSACHAYLSGSVGWWRGYAEEKIKNQPNFKALGVNNFRSQAARGLRDVNLSKKTVCFLHQAFRYRGKANYRESLFLGYGNGTEQYVTDYISDLSFVLEAFVRQAGIFCSKRINKKKWEDFLEDLANNRSFTLSPDDIWGG